MTLTFEQLEVLMRPLHPSRVQSRSQGGATLSYLAAFDVKAMLIRVFGFGGFSAEVTDAKIIDIDRGDDGKVRVAAMATVRLTIPSLGCVYTETAIAGQTGKSVGDVADFAMKTAESDALKRAATYLGTQYGLSLYNNGSTKEVVQRILAPGQEWPPSDGIVDGDTGGELTEDQAQMLAESLGAEQME